ncbi:MAG: 50S ribosomal protein L33, partial [Flavobacteriia bacterium]|nr:50S ribosomal protein L33 [Candidatus Bostrichicola ureolyticus]
YRNKLLLYNELPIKATTHTSCFRREAGSYGSNVKGLNRVHQFEKVEIIQITTDENSYAALDDMVLHIKNILKMLKLPFRILRLCGGQMGFTAEITYDFEVYAAGQKKWLEVSSVSNCSTFQSYRLKLRYRTKDNNIKLCHTLNGSALALPRILAALLENNQMIKYIKIKNNMAKKGNRIQVILECTEHKKHGFYGISRYITTKNKKNTPNRLELKKYNPILKKKTIHKEIK